MLRTYHEQSAKYARCELVVLLILTFFHFLISIGLNEDAVTGSALCALAPYYLHKFHPQVTPNTGTEPVLLNSYQASQRGGRAQVAVLPAVVSSGGGEGGDSGDGHESRVLISGHCVTVMQSVFML